MGLSTLLPLELIGVDVASGRSRTTGRQHDLSLRLAVALFGHQGIEWDITAATPEERHGLAEWVSLAKSQRDLLYSGELVRIERPSDPGTSLFGVVAMDRSEALFVLVRSYTSPQSESPPIRFDGLDRDARYLVRRLRLPGESPATPGSSRARTGAEDVAVPGSLLMGPGVLSPYVQPDGAALFHLTRTSSARA